MSQESVDYKLEENKSTDKHKEKMKWYLFLSLSFSFYKINIMIVFDKIISWQLFLIK